jgi:hypothetical protein
VKVDFGFAVESEAAVRRAHVFASSWGVFFFWFCLVRSLIQYALWLLEAPTQHPFDSLFFLRTRYRCIYGGIYTGAGYSKGRGG